MKTRRFNKASETNPTVLTGVIVTIRGKRVIVDTDLASLYGVKTKRLKEQVKRNRERFPEDFMFELTPEEMAKVVAVCDHLERLKFSSVLPLAFTEHGAIMAANVLNSRVAIEASIMVVRAFIHAREILAEHIELKRRLENLERKVARGFEDNEDELNAIRFTLQQLMLPLEQGTKKLIGFGREK